MARMTESTVEEAALGWLEALGWQVKHGPEIAAGEPAAERSNPDRARAGGGSVGGVGTGMRVQRHRGVRSILLGAGEA